MSVRSISGPHLLVIHIMEITEQNYQKVKIIPTVIQHPIRHRRAHSYLQDLRQYFGQK